MLIKLTNATTKYVFGLSANVIWAVERSASSGVITKVLTTMRGDQGMVAFDVFESPEDICDQIAILLGKSPWSGKA